MQKLTYINLLHQSITFGGEPPYILEHVKGLGKPPVNISTTRGAYQHGDTPRRILMEPRFVDLTFHIRGENRADLYQKRVELMDLLSFERAFDGKRQGRLFYENDYGRWWLHAVPEGPDPEKRVMDWMLSSKLSFRCANPYWNDDKSIKMLALSMSAGGFSFPFSFPIQFGDRRFSGVAFNNGQAATPLHITIFGSGEMPVLVNNSTGAQLTVSQPIPGGSRLIIDTDPETLSVVMRDANGYEAPAHGYLTLDSPLSSFVLRRGENDIEYKPNQPSAQSRVELQWSERMEGV